MDIFYRRSEPVYIGTEIKFLIDLQCKGFDMDDDDWKLDIVCGGHRETMEKTGTYPSNVEMSDSLVREEDGWYGYLETEGLKPGAVKAIATVYIADSEAHDGIRQEIDVTELCHLERP